MNTEFRKQLSTKLKGVNYMSETDAPFSVFEHVREKTFNEFFAPLVREYKWMSDEEKKSARKFREIKNFIDANMKRKRVYLIGKINIVILIVGRDLSGAPLIIQTLAVET